MREIAEGWLNYVTKNPEMKDEAERRIGVCLPCNENSTKGEIKTTSTCKACGCVLLAKSFSKKSTCPKGKW